MPLISLVHTSRYKQQQNVGVSFRFEFTLKIQLIIQFVYKLKLKEILKKK